jgi:hypothetical protein
MKNKIKNSIKFLIASFGTVLLMNSCNKYQEIGDTAWPDQLIYMPAAIYNNFTIDVVPKAVGADPTPGYPTRFLVDTTSRKFNILLGAYRSGVTNDGSFVVDIAVNTDTITKLLPIVGKLPVGTILLPSANYSILSTVKMNDGSDIAKFDLSVDLDYLLTNSPTGKYAIAVGISSTARKTNRKYATTIIVIDTKIMKPSAAFTSTVSGTNSKILNFTNTSLYGKKYTWNFGDGSEKLVTTNDANVAVSHTYAAAGSYTVTLTVVGVADYAQKSVFSAVKVVV